MKLISLEELKGLIATDTPTDDLMSLYNTCLQMQTLCKKEKGIGISAIQVGISWKLFIVDWNGQYRYFLNAEYNPLETLKLNSIEGCLSIKDSYGKLVFYKTERYDEIVVKGLELVVEYEKPMLKNLELMLKGKYSIVFQHEIDHQNGVLILDIGNEMNFW